MLFTEALTQLHAGKPMARTCWNPEDGYLMLMPNMEYVWKIIGKPTPNAGNFIFSVADFEASDWEEYVVPVEVAVSEVTSE